MLRFERHMVVVIAVALLFLALIILYVIYKV